MICVVDRVPQSISFRSIWSVPLTLSTSYWSTRTPALPDLQSLQCLRLKPVCRQRHSNCLAVVGSHPSLIILLLWQLHQKHLRLKMVIRLSEIISNNEFRFPVACARCCPVCKQCALLVASSLQLTTYLCIYWCWSFRIWSAQTNFRSPERL